MSRATPSATFTTEFGHEFEAERERLLRRRFLWYTSVNTFFGVLAFVAAGVGLAFLRAQAPIGATIAGLVGNGVLTAVYVASLVYVLRSRRLHIPLMGLTYWLIVLTGVVALVVGVISVELSVGSTVSAPGVRIDVGGDPAPAGPDPTVAGMAAPPETDAAPRIGRDSRALAVAASGTWQICIAHFFACLFLPWTPRESIRPLIPLLILNGAITLIYTILGGAWLVGILTILFSPLVALPGVGICWWRHSRLREGFQTKLIMRRYGEMRQELFNARQIHEALFPKPCSEGSMHFSYRYEPMRQIGGDYLYCRFCPRPGAQSTLSLVVIDVTGHGIPAALTVNRLHGELERIYAEDPGVAPGEVLRLLNRYVHLTLATHSVYVTAFCVRLDPDSSTLDYASGGHPPAFIRTVDNRIEELGSTALVLGAARGEDFDPEPQSLPFGPGDTLIAYTDGAIEARDRAGRFYGIAGLRRLIASRRPDSFGGWPATILGEVDAFRFGPPADDTLVIEVVRQLDSVRPSVPSVAPKSAAAV
jgi:hypothetical protein